MNRSHFTTRTFAKPLSRFLLRNSFFESRGAADDVEEESRRTAFSKKVENIVNPIMLAKDLAGVAAQLSTSPLLAALVCGAMLANLRGGGARGLETLIQSAEPVFAMLFFLLAGVLLNPTPPPAMVLLALGIVLVRVFVKPVGDLDIAQYLGRVARDRPDSPLP